MAQVSYKSIPDYDFTLKGKKSSLWKACRSFANGAFSLWGGYAREFLSIGRTYPNRVKQKNMTNLMLCITDNIDLKTFTFCTAGTISQYADKVGVDKSTVSRHLANLIELGELVEAFPGEKASTNDPKAGLIRKPNLIDDNGEAIKGTGVYLPRVLRVTNKFFERRCPQEVVDEIFADHDAALKKSKLTLKEALLEVRDRVYGHAFKKYDERMSLKLGWRKSPALKRCKTRADAITLITRQIHREYSKAEILDMSEGEINYLVLRRLKVSGWAAAPPG